MTEVVSQDDKLPLNKTTPLFQLLSMLKVD